MVETAQTSVLKSKRVSELAEHKSRVFRGVGLERSVVEMNLDLSVSPMAVPRQLRNKVSLVLLGRIKIGMDEGPALIVPPFLHQVGIHLAPALHPSLLLGMRGSRRSLPRHNGRFKMIGKRKNQVNAASGRTPHHALPAMTGKPA